MIGAVVGGIYAAAALGQSDSSSPAAHGMHHGPGRLIKLIIKSADLTPDQQSQVRQIVAANRAAAHDTFTQLHQAKTDLANLLLGPQAVQTDALSTQLAQVGQLKQQLAQQRASTVLAVRGLLTPDQLAKVAAAKDQLSTWRHHKCAESGPAPGA
jgi:Spy/CpxP family protein refolding chaperone